MLALNDEIKKKADMRSGPDVEWQGFCTTTLDDLTVQWCIKTHAEYFRTCSPS